MIYLIYTFEYIYQYSNRLIQAISGICMIHLVGPAVAGLFDTPPRLGLLAAAAAASSSAVGGLGGHNPIALKPPKRLRIIETA